MAAGAAVSAASAGSAISIGGATATESGDIALLAVGGTAPAESPSSSPSTASSAAPSQPTSAISAPAVAEDSRTAMVSTLYAGTEINAQREIAEEQARRPKVVMPAAGDYTSPFAMRWGVMHGGIDIANVLGTPIVAATDGIVIDAGPAQGFGNWIRIKADDGTMTVYGHMQTLDVQVGQRVVAGQQIAGMGSLGFSTGSHVHFEVFVNGGTERVDPAVWLTEQGLSVTGGDAPIVGS